MEKFWLILGALPKSNRGMSPKIFKTLRFFTTIIFLIGLIACQAKFLKVENPGQIAKMEEYDEKVKVRELPLDPQMAQAIAAQHPEATTTSTSLIEDIKNKKKVKPSPSPKPSPIPKVVKRMPELEDTEGFQGRRPIVDPFWIGEKTVLAMSYFGAKAGEMAMSVDPYVEVNGKKSYKFSATIKSSPFFSAFYAVDDYGETFMDFNEMIPFNILIKVKESAQLREVRSFFDWKTFKANYWERKVTKQRGTEEKKHEWGIDPYTHNAFSAAYYLRTFKLTPGKVIKFKVADENRNMVVTGNVIRREEIETDAGKFNTVVVRPEIAMDGVFTPMGDVFFWLTDDDRKMYVKIEAKIRIGTIKAEAIQVIPGVKPL